MLQRCTRLQRRGLGSNTCSAQTRRPKQVEDVLLSGRVWRCSVRRQWERRFRSDPSALHNIASSIWVMAQHGHARGRMLDPGANTKSGLLFLTAYYLMSQVLAGMLVVRGPSPSQSFVCAPGHDFEPFGVLGNYISAEVF